MLKFTTPKLAHYLFPKLIWNIRNRENKIFLTFYDGPIPGPTEEVLEILSNHQVKATFFCVGDNIRKYPHIYTKILNEEHQIGNHTFHHLKGWKSDTRTYIKDVMACNEIMQKYGKLETSLFRPPYGKISFRQISRLKDYRIIMWDVLSRDFDHRFTSQVILANIKKHTRSGSIIVFHDSLKSIDKIKKILPDYIMYCQQKGFKFSTI